MGFRAPADKLGDVGLREGFRSGLEEKVADQLRALGIEVKFEERRVKYTTLGAPLREGGEPIFDARSTELGSDALFGNPSADLVSSSLKSLGVFGQQAHGKRFSQADARNLVRILPFQNLNGVSQLLSTMISPLPEWSPKK